MLSNRQYLDRCNKLTDLGIRPSFEVGEVVARGFADLGYEEFMILPGPKTLSLMTGAIVRISEEEKGHLFLVPDIQQLVNLIEGKGIAVQSINYIDHRSWEVTCEIAGKSELFKDRELNKALIEAFLKA